MVQLHYFIFKHLDDFLTQWLVFVSPYTMSGFYGFLYSHILDDILLFMSSLLHSDTYRYIFATLIYCRYSM